MDSQNHCDELGVDTLYGCGDFESSACSFPFECHFPNKSINWTFLSQRTCLLRICSQEYAKSLECVARVLMKCMRTNQTGVHLCQAKHIFCSNVLGFFHSLFLYFSLSNVPTYRRYNLLIIRNALNRFLANDHQTNKVNLILYAQNEMATINDGIFACFFLL